MPSGIYLRKTLEQRFWEKVVVRGIDDCWEWLGGNGNKAGYGSIRVDGKNRCATHVLFYIRQGYWPPRGKQANHHCDNSGCLNPKHLYLGTQKSNMRDRDFRGRGNQPKGEKNGRAKLTVNEVKQIKRLYAQGDVTQKQLGQKFSVSDSNISYIVNEKGSHWVGVK